MKFSSIFKSKENSMMCEHLAISSFNNDFTTNRISCFSFYLYLNPTLDSAEPKSESSDNFIRECFA